VCAPACARAQPEIEVVRNRSRRWQQCNAAEVCPSIVMLVFGEVVRSVTLDSSTAQRTLYCHHLCTGMKVDVGA
jgi:hypothetical protein